MTTQPSQTQPDGINRERLFVASCFALAVSAVAFAVIGDILATLKTQFILSNLQVGYIGGAAVWGFTISILIFGPLCDTLGMRFLLRSAVVCHVVGVLIMISSSGFWMLFWGALVLSLGNGLVEAACNPLVATLFPDNKTVKLNQFHVWWPAGIVLGGLASYGLNAAGFGSWQLRLGLILIPAVIYGFLMMRESFPETENAQAGVGFGEMIRTTISTPLFLLMLFAMFITASIELGPNRWIPAVLESGGIPGILILVWISGLMAVLRLWASGPLIRRLSPTGILVISTALASIGLLWLSFAESGVVAFASATVFALGICFIWPTMLGFVSERIPKSGALGLALMGGAGMGVVGLVAAPLLGQLADGIAHERFASSETILYLERASAFLTAEMESVPADQRGDVSKSVVLIENVLTYNDTEGVLPEVETANAYRAIIGSGVKGEIVDEAEATLGPAENYGGRLSFRFLVPLGIFVTLIFALIYRNDKRRGGYQSQVDKEAAEMRPA
jgi:fucose permease